MPGYNEMEMRRVAGEIRSFATAGTKAGVRITRRNLVKDTPKLTQLAAWWQLGVGGPPAFEPLDEPKREIYPLVGDHETDSDLADFELGDDIVIRSSATYIKWLNKLGNSPQAPKDFVPDAVDRSMNELRSWRWEGP